MISKTELERFRLTSSRPFDEVPASIKGAVGQDLGIHGISGWWLGINGQAFTNADIVASAPAELGNSRGTMGS